MYLRPVCRNHLFRHKLSTRPVIFPLIAPSCVHCVISGPIYGPVIIQRFPNRHHVTIGWAMLGLSSTMTALGPLRPRNPKCVRTDVSKPSSRDHWLGRARPSSVMTAIRPLRPRTRTAQALTLRTHSLPPSRRRLSEHRGPYFSVLSVLFFICNISYHPTFTTL